MRHFFIGHSSADHVFALIQTTGDFQVSGGGGPHDEATGNASNATFSSISEGLNLYPPQ